MIFSSFPTHPLTKSIPSFASEMLKQGVSLSPGAIATPKNFTPGSLSRPTVGRCAGNPSSSVVKPLCLSAREIFFCPSPQPMADTKSILAASSAMFAHAVSSNRTVTTFYQSKRLVFRGNKKKFSWSAMSVISASNVEVKNCLFYHGVTFLSIKRRCFHG